MTTSQVLKQLPQMLTLEDAACELKIGIDSLLDLCVTGQLTCFRLGQTGGVLRIIRRDLEACRLRSSVWVQESHNA